MPSSKAKKQFPAVQIDNQVYLLKGAARLYLDLPGDVQEAIKAHIATRARRTRIEGLSFNLDLTFRELVADALLARERGESMLDAVTFQLEDPGTVLEAQFQKYDVYVAPRDDSGGRW